MSISVVIPSIPRRSGLLGEALQSVYDQELAAAETCVAVDTREEGAAATRQRALSLASSDWVAFLDDDDLMLTEHLRVLMDGATEHNADYVFSYFVRKKGGDPLGHFGKRFDNAAPHHTTMTILVRTELAKRVGFANHVHANGSWPGEDWAFTLGCVELGAKIVHVPQETWIWRRHAGNTSGLPGRGDAR